MNTFILKVLATDNPFFEGESTSLIVPTLDGQYGILAHHSNMISAITPGILTFKDKDEKEIKIKVSNGMVKFESNVALVLVEDAYLPEDEEKILKEKEEKHKKEKEIQRKSINDYLMAQARISREMSKLSNKKMD